MLRHGPQYYQKEPSHWWLLCFGLYLWPLLIIGCMQTVPAPLPPTPRQVSNLTADLRKIQSDRSSALASLATKCKPLAAEDAKKLWNTEYHQIVSDSVLSMTTTLKSGLDKATTDADRVKFWTDVEAGFQ